VLVPPRSDGEPLAEVLARVRFMLPRSTVSPLPKCDDGAIDVAEVDSEPLAKVLPPLGSMESPLLKCSRGCD
jgi:hypothetical protein